MAIDTIKSSAVLDGAIASADIADDAVTAAKLGAGAVDTTALGTDAVTTAKVADDAITQALIAAGAVGNTEVASGISASKLTTGTLPTAQLAAGTVLQTKFIQQFVNAGATTFTVTGAIGGGGLFGGSQGNRTYSQAGSTITITPRATSSKLVVYATIHFTYFPSVATTAHGLMVSLNDNANTGGTGANPALESGDFPFYSTHNVSSSGIYWPPQTITGVFSPNVTSACELKLRAFGYRESSGTHNVAYRGYNMIVQEIAG